MRPRHLTLFICLALAGCATPARLSEREAAAGRDLYARICRLDPVQAISVSK